MTPTDAVARALRILVVDDDELDRLAVRRCLTRAGLAVTVDEAGTAGEALEQIAPDTYDCILLDYYLPGADTVELLGRFREAAGETPVVILTGRGDEDVAVGFMKAGAVDYVPKASLSAERLATSFRYAQEMALQAQARRRAEADLREREAEFRTLANAIPQLAWIADTEARRYWYNDRWHQYTGLRPDQSLGLGWRLAHHPDHSARVYEGMLRAFKAEQEWEDTYPLRRADGEFRWFLVRAVPIRDADGRIQRWIGTNTDISERLEAEWALSASEDRFRRALEIETVGIAFFNTDGAITGANESFLRMSGYTREDVLAGRVRWDDLTPPDFKPHTHRAVEEFKATGRTTPYMKQYVRQDGSRSWALFAATRLSEREGVEFVLDMTAQKESELELEASLEVARTARAQAERARSIRDEVLAILAHDLRNPMQTILGATATLELIDDEAARQRYTDIIRRATQSMDRLVTDLLDMARIDSGTFVLRKEPVDVAALIREAVDLFETQAAGREIVLRTEIAPDLEPVAADRDRLMQLLSNLLGNAMKFTGAGGSVCVQAEKLGDGVAISVEDTGVGIPPADLPRIFDRFWQARRATRAGAGLGLSISKGIVEAHGGRLGVDSTLGRGTTIRFCIGEHSDSLKTEKVVS